MTSNPNSDSNSNPNANSNADPNSSHDGYVHDPSEFDADGERIGGDGADVDGDDEWLEEPIHPDTIDREFGWRGWVLVAVIVFAFVVAPLSILLWPPSLDYWVALLILPLAPAIALGLTAVWATTRP